MKSVKWGERGGFLSLAPSERSEMSFEQDSLFVPRYLILVVLEIRPQQQNNTEETIEKCWVNMLTFRDFPGEDRQGRKPCVDWDNRSEVQPGYFLKKRGRRWGGEC